MTHGAMASSDHERLISTPPGRRPQNASQFDFEEGGRVYACFPPYHLAGVQIYIMQPLFSEKMTVVMGPPFLPPSGELVYSIMKQQRIRALYLPPSIIEQWASEPGAIDQARDLDFILFGGGPLSPPVGKKLEDVTSIRQVFGGLETGGLQMLVPDKEDWNWLEFNPSENYDFQAVDDGLYELVIHNTPEYCKTRPLYHNYPEIKEWRTRDMFTPHPSKPGLWRFVSRVDDTVVLASGHKVQAPPLETIIQGSPHLSGTLIIGHGRPQPALIVEPKRAYFEDGGSAQSLIQEIWPFVESANREAPSYMKIVRSMIIVAGSDKPFIRAPKGTVVRKSTAEQFQSEIEALYTDSHGDNAGPLKFKLSEHTLPGAKEYVRSVFAAVLSPDTELQDTSNIFFAGIDSLTSKEVAQILQRGLPSSVQQQHPPITAKTIYSHPTISSLAEAILKMVHGVPIGEFHNQDQAIEEMKRTVEEFTQDLLPLPSTPAKRKSLHTTDTPASQGIQVALIGPRGSLAPQMLRNLLASPKVTRIYCLSRGGGSGSSSGDNALQDLQSTLQTRFPHDNLPPHFAKLAHVPIDLSHDRLGIDPEHWTTLTANIHLIIHNAWKRDFSMTLPTFSAQLIRSVRGVIDLSLASTGSALQKPRIVFLSSVASVYHWSAVTSNPVPESPVNSYEAAPPYGYGQSKHVAERILSAASERANVPVTVLRVGQVAGPTVPDEGVWAEDEWLPRVAMLSRFMGTVPVGLPGVDWVPVDVMGRVVAEIAMHDVGVGMTVNGNAEEEKVAPTEGIAVYNLVNPQQAPWSDFVQALETRIGDATVKHLPFPQWVDALNHRFSGTAETSKDPVAVSAVKILPYLQYLAECMEKGPKRPEFHTEKAVRVSQGMAGLGPIGREMMEVWCRQWGI
ncbi:MAG: putative secondary metabolism biosynthetic enzyme [Alyxoria varia]|nr:MAG: putative secondary metabolism biosynthetic enzyme [Alyxoria varia]